MSEIHPTAAAGFSAARRSTSGHGPGYPDEAVAWVAERLGIGPGRDVLDLAAGTGKLTRQLVPLGARIVAVEPIDAMRAELERAVPAVEALAGTAEAIPLPDGSVDAVTCAQAFHWFRADEAVREIRRVLRPGGGLALLWNGRDLDDPKHGAWTSCSLRIAASSPPVRSTGAPSSARSSSGPGGTRRR